MSNTTLNVGDFCWAELYAYDIDKSLKFYTTLFDWNIESLTIGQDISYRIIKVNNKAIAGGIQINAAMKTLGVRPHWNSFILVEDILASVATAKKLGGTIIRDVTDLAGKGKMTVIVDTTGASFSLWQPSVVAKVEEPFLAKSLSGNIGWNELVTNDLDRAGEFYGELFQWTQKTENFLPNETYTTWLNKAVPVASLLKPMANRSPGWSLYFITENVEDCMNKAKKIAGQICHDPIDSVEGGRFITIRDPDGLYFSVIELAR